MSMESESKKKEKKFTKTRRGSPADCRPSTNWKNQHILQNFLNFWANDVILISFEISSVLSLAGWGISYSLGLAAL